MSRNLRHKQPATPGRKTVRRSSRTTDTSDDDYAGVDLISDSEEEEPDVEVAEEQAIIDSEEDDDAPTPRPSVDEQSWEGFDTTSQDDVLGGDGAFFDDHMARMNKPDIDTQITAWNATNGQTDDEDTPEARRVRFDLGSDSSDSLSDNDDSIFPDIFLDQNSLDPAFRKIIENGDEADDDPASSNDGSYWDFRGSDAEDAPDGSDNEDNKSQSSVSSSGYETDEGETTEEDLPPERYISGRSVLAQPSSDDSDSESEEDITVIRRKFRPAPRGPKLGSWVADRSKPFAILDNHGKTLIMFKAKARRFSFSAGSNRVPIGYASEGDAETPGVEHMSPMMSDSANLMMSAMWPTMDNTLGGQVLGPPEAFYPHVSVNADGSYAQDSLSSYDEDDMDDEDLWNVEDFLEFGDNTTDDEAEAVDEEDDSENTTADPLSSTPARPRTANEEDQVHPLLNHFNSGVVGAFRRNQTRHQLLSRNAATRESLAFSGPYRQGTLRGIKGGRLAAANTPITPLRRQKLPKPAPLPSSPGSPLAAHKKRKFSGEQNSHKRTRSLV
ncbi:hypothetical protein BP5796_08771 [Coleophoma crateriformis]|uniref:Uncharacterized protein n=1 Tax=Coleophoma crateriformis TaxID=565419 RepID=A0A3D8R937_9HELO|nr:hypothetical protein BP5796_08771 [Coleophoma crateriformis]